MVEYHDSWQVSGVYVAVLSTVVLRMFAYVWLLIGVKETQFTKNIPYETLGMDLVAALILFGVALGYGYYTNLILYFCQVCLISYLIVVKYTLEK